MDVSKQGFGALVIHFWNIFLSHYIAVVRSTSMYTQQDVFLDSTLADDGTTTSSSSSTSIVVNDDGSDDGDGRNDECAFYFLSFLLDMFIGVTLIFYGLHFVSSWAKEHDVAALIQSGFYPKPVVVSYLAQTVAYLLIVVSSKILITALELLFQHHLEAVGNALFSPISKNHPQLELMVVMVICPFFLNIILFWIVDSILMNHSSSSFSSASSGSKSAYTAFSNHDYEPIYASSDSEDEESRRFRSPPTDFSQQGGGKQPHQRHLGYYGSTHFEHSREQGQDSLPFHQQEGGTFG